VGKALASNHRSLQSFHRSLQKISGCAGGMVLFHRGKEKIIMTTTIIDGAAGILQLLVAAYALRLNRAFEMARVGWPLFCAFGLLALLHFVQAAATYFPGATTGRLGEAILLLVPLLLFAGMMHLETLLHKRTLQEQAENRRRAELELEVKKKTGYLMRAIEGLDSEMAERKRMEAMIPGLEKNQPGLFDCFADMIANIPVQAIRRVLAEESYMLGLDLAQQRPLLPTEVGSILVFAQFVSAGGKCPHSLQISMELPPAQVAFYRKTVRRLIDYGELPRLAADEFEQLFGTGTAKPKASQPLLPQMREGVETFQLPELAHC
jgi:hypothetical protein